MAAKKKLDFTIRPAMVDDCENIFLLMQELVAYHHLEQYTELTFEEFRRDGFGEKPCFQAFVAETTEATPQEKKMIGYALFHERYSSCKGRCLYMEDIHVNAAYRGLGVGHELFKTGAKMARDAGMRAMYWVAEADNKLAIEFYDRHGSINATEKEGWQFYRLEGDLLKKLADS